MPRIEIPKREDAVPESKQVLDNVDKMLGFVPNLHRLTSISPTALSGWATLMASLAKTLDVKTREGIALPVSEADGCDYCLAAHSFVAGNLTKIPADEIELNREGRSSDPKRQAAVAFAKALIETRGKVSDAQFAAVRDAGWTDANIVEMIALTAQFLLTNFMNNAVQTPIDFPEVSPALSVARCGQALHSDVDQRRAALLKCTNPSTVASPVGAYSHSVEVPANAEMALDCRAGGLSSQWHSCRGL
jgi:uncharacterized peroxidase-related enzyme